MSKSKRNTRASNDEEVQTPSTMTLLMRNTKGRKPSVNDDNDMMPPPATRDISNGRKKSPRGRAVAVVTPSLTDYEARKDEEEVLPQQRSARRTLFPSNTLMTTVVPPTPKRKADEPTKAAPHAKRRLIFGKYSLQPIIPSNVQTVYKIVKKLTGSIGGNGYCGPIYGELTMGSMHKMVAAMMENTGFNQSSRFIDVGSGIGKPNLHVAQYPGVQFSCGVEVEQTRWSLGMTCLKAVLDAAVKDPDESILGNTVFLHKDIMEAKTFDPFTHVYMFSIGFPPNLWLQLSDMWNQSQSEYLICYHGPKDIINNYEFNVELLTQLPTSMHGSKEGHMGYIYRRQSIQHPSSQSKGTCAVVSPESSTHPALTLDAVPCDPLFRPSWDLVQEGLRSLHEDVTQQMDGLMGGGRRTRSRR